MGQDREGGGRGLGSGSIERLLRERSRLDEILRTEFRKRMAVFFSDVCGFTRYVDLKGDIAGRAWIQKHHDMVLPLIEQHQGRILDVMGDGIMAAFPSTLFAVRAAVEVQKCLDQYNRQTAVEEGIHVRIGINAGEVLADEGHIAGDVVNVAARIQTRAGPDQILVSKEGYEEICGSEDFLCRFHEVAYLKGKSRPLELYRVVWGEEQGPKVGTPLIRTHGGPVTEGPRAVSPVLHLEIAREGNVIKISSHEQVTEEASTIRHYEEIHVSMDWIETQSTGMLESLNRANRAGRIPREALVRLRDLGQSFSDELFTLSVKEQLDKTEASHLTLHLDDRLVHVPWELLHDGKSFLCQRFGMGRVVKTRQMVAGTRPRTLARPLRMLILADPEDDLKGAYEEGVRIRDLMDSHRDLVMASLRSDDITSGFVREKMRNFDVIHFAGHADYDPQNMGGGGWRLTDGGLTPQDVIKMAGSAPMPALVFSNACQSARTAEWTTQTHFHQEVFGLANAFVLAGVRHYVGTFWEILDEPSRHFALSFYRSLLSGHTVGEAVQEARMALIREYGEETVVWASYLLYGDPTSDYLGRIRAREPEKGRPSPKAAPQEIGRTRKDVIDFRDQETSARKRKRVALLVVSLLVALVAGLGWLWIAERGTKRLAEQMVSAYRRGDLDAALIASRSLEKRDPDASLAYLIQGHVHLSGGRLAEARESYQKALKVGEGSPDQKAEALMGLGRIAAQENRYEEALSYYKEASKKAARNPRPYVSEAVLLARRGEAQEALDLLGKAESLAPGDMTVAALAKRMEERLRLQGDEQRRQRIDRMVKELLDRMKHAPPPPSPDGWTSRPLGLWVMAFKSRGLSLEVGEGELLAGGIQEYLLETTRVRPVERAVLDGVLEELKLGTSPLADSKTALSLGRLMAARLILTGRAVHAGPITQISVRLIETETGKVAAVLTMSFPEGVPNGEMAKQLADAIGRKIEDLYPLRGKVQEVKGTEARLNIGERAGVRLGQRLRVLNQDTVLEVTAVEPESCWVRAISGSGPLQMGQRVEALDEA